MRSRYWLPPLASRCRFDLCFPFAGWLLGSPNLSRLSICLVQPLILVLYRKAGTGMPYIIGLGTAVPANVVHQDEARDYAAQHFTRFLPHMDRLTTVFKHAAIDSRYFVVPHDWWDNTEHSQQECNDVYIREATALCAQAIGRALESAGVSAQDVNNLFFINSTGIATPSIDAILINRLGMCGDVRRTPIWGLGCAGGVVGL